MIRLSKKDARLASKRWRMSNLYRIRREDKTLGKLVFNEVQEKLFAKAEALNFKSIRDIEAKGRKEGVTTFWAIFYLDDTLFSRNTSSCIMAHRDKDMTKIFDIVKLAYKTCPEAIELTDGRVWRRPVATSETKYELKFEDLNSIIYVTLENRGGTNNNLHISEAAYTAEERIKATIGSVPVITTGSNITGESTSNGVGGWFYDTMMEAVNGTSPFSYSFFPWYMAEKYRLEPPKGWKPGEEERMISLKVKEDSGTVLDDWQLFWWKTTKGYYGQLMDQEFPSTLMDSFLVSGRLAFSREHVRAINPKEPKRVEVVQVDRMTPEETLSGVRVRHSKQSYEINIYKEPRKDRSYVLAGDPAEGVQNDDSSIRVVDDLTLEEVASFDCDTIPPDEFAQVVDKVGRIYNMALVVIEENNHGHAVINALKLKYPRLYKREYFDEKARKKTKKIGFRTDTHTRDLILDEFDQLIRECSIGVNSAILASQLLTFIVNDDGKRIAKAGHKDDAIMAMAIAVKIARLPKSTFIIQPVS